MFETIISKDAIHICKLTQDNTDQMYQLLKKQPKDHIDTWGNAYDLEECRERIRLATDENILLYGIVNNNELVGLVGVNHFSDYIDHDFDNCYFTHVLVDYHHLRMGIAKTSMKLLLEHVKQINKFHTNNKIHAAIYRVNKSSMYLHNKLQFKITKLIDEYDIVVMEYDIKNNR